MKRSIFKSVVFPEPSDDEGYRPVGARPIASRQDDGDAEFTRPKVTEFDLSGRYQPRPVEQLADEEIGTFLEGEASNPANRFALYTGETDVRHTDLNDFLADKADAYIGGDERTYRPGLVETERDHPGGYSLSERDNNTQPRRVGEAWLLPSMTGVTAEATVTPNFAPVAKAKDVLRADWRNLFRRQEYLENGK